MKFGSRQFRFTNKIIMAEQSDKLQQLYMHKNYFYNSDLLISDTQPPLMFFCSISIKKNGTFDFGTKIGRVKIHHLL